ncbi:MAG: SEC-C domain-containing protein [Clostridia bacterium]|nr:SEC-C domain-containing protein [Clostridia bacterium]
MTIIDRLMRLDQNDLEDALYRLTGRDETNLSRAALADDIAKVYAETPARLRRCLGLHALNSLQERMKQRGLTLTGGEAEEDGALWSTVDSLVHFGLCAETVYGWAMAPECRQLLKPGQEENERLAADEMLFAVADGLLAHVGMLEKGAFCDQVSRFVPAMTEVDLMDVIAARYGLRAWFRVDSLMPGGPEEIWICFPELEDAEVLLQELDVPEVMRIPYADIPLSSLISAHMLSMPVTAEQMDGYLRAMAQVNVKEPDATDLLYQAVCEIQNGGGEPGGRSPGPEVSGEAAAIISQTCENLPRWNLKGHTPGEAASLFRAAHASQLHPLTRSFDGPRVIPFPAGKPPVPDISPDAPCPCGSGKTFGACHGRKM